MAIVRTPSMRDSSGIRTSAHSVAPATADAGGTSTTPSSFGVRRHRSLRPGFWANGCAGNLSASTAVIDPSPILKPMRRECVVAPQSMTRRTKSVDVHRMPTNLKRALLRHVASALRAGLAGFKPDSQAAAFSRFQWGLHGDSSTLNRHFCGKHKLPRD